MNDTKLLKEYKQLAKTVGIFEAEEQMEKKYGYERIHALLWETTIYSKETV